jgi:hypothetical protein
LTTSLPTTFIGKRAVILEMYLSQIMRGKEEAAGHESGFGKQLSQKGNFTHELLSLQLKT